MLGLAKSFSRLDGGIGTPSQGMPPLGSHVTQLWAQHRDTVRRAQASLVGAAVKGRWVPWQPSHGDAE